MLNAKEIIRDNNDERLILLSFKDITESKMAQQRMEEKNTELEKMNNELQSFTYVASHDLQEPLRKIQTFSTRLLERESHNLSETGKEYFQRMQDAAQRMQTLIEDLLSFSKVNNSEKEFETKAVKEIVEEVKKDFIELIEEKHATIEYNDMCTIKLIPFQFRQLFQNLIHNSIKFSIPGHFPHIVIKSRTVKGNELPFKKLLPEKVYCHISVRDNGIGFEEEFNEKIFEIFQRLHGRSEYPGTGIGLAIVKKIIDNHNGVITAKGEVGKGATFDIYIPE